MYKHQILDALDEVMVVMQIMGFYESLKAPVMLLRLYLLATA